MVNTNQKFYHECAEFIQEFVDIAKAEYDPLVFLIITTIAQFLCDVKRQLKEGDKKGISFSQLIEMQIRGLRRCVVDLERNKELLLHGGTMQ